jgi:hypothetical protein
MTTPFQLSPLTVLLILAVVVLPGGLLLSPLLMRRRSAASPSPKTRRALQQGAVMIGDDSLRSRRANARVRAISQPLAN